MTIDIDATHSFTNGDLTLHYASVGPASAPSHSWWDFALHLAPKGYQCFLLDDGKSDRAGGRYTRTDYTSDVTFGKKCVLVGHSLGVVMAYGASAARPELVAGMLLEDPPMYMTFARLTSSPYQALFAKVREDCKASKSANLPVAHVQQLMAADPIAPGVPVTMSESLTEAGLVSLAQGLLSVDPAVYDAVLSSDGATTDGDDKPSCAVGGVLLRAQKELGAFREEDVERFRKTAPNVEVVEVKGAGHMIHPFRASRGAVVETLGKVFRAAFRV
ncbi:alpha/beta-hydrolase [Gonapodya prolifera JEL478]|uniref:Alpha/beta-hydrolase n=1 Tax=Gonapodya prolifera (strain JEL478) TaxID=1344416 RepID=A0A139ACN9_GONPJ|nr:alpha/beta-hydrolase [Gonapodya prolifera JEL478]|eukprot:KXS14344.1 alpha/beta-hydrolase [Gonapodya prolifera JEL478]